MSLLLLGPYKQRELFLEKVDQLHDLNEEIVDNGLVELGQLGDAFFDLVFIVAVAVDIVLVLPGIVDQVGVLLHAHVGDELVAGLHPVDLVGEQFWISFDLFALEDLLGEVADAGE